MTERVRRGMRGGLMLATVVVSCVLPALAARHSHFFKDYVYSLHALRRDGLLDFVLTPVNIQLVPLHRAAVWLTDTLFGFRYPPALGVLLVIHGFGVALMYRVVARLVALARPSASDGTPAAAPRSRLSPAALTFVYASCPALAIQYFWFSAGLHRFPYALATLFAFDRWLRYRQSGGACELVWVVVALLLACGFYGKGPLLAAHLVALELCLWSQTPHAQRIRHVQVLAPLLGLAAALAIGNGVLAASMSDSRAGLRLPPVSKLMLFQWEALQTLVKALSGELAPREFGMASPTLALFIGGAGLCGLAWLSIAQRRDNVWVWLVIMACILGNTGVVATSNRWVFGLTSAHAHRYVLDQLVVLVPLLAIALSGIRLSDGVLWSGRPLMCLVLLAVAAHGVLDVRRQVAGDYRELAQRRVFLDRLTAELARVRRAHPDGDVTFETGPMPAFLRGWEPDFRSLEDLTIAMGHGLRFGRRGELRILPNGRIVPVPRTW